MIGIDKTSGGGATARSGGIFYAGGGTPIQKEAGVEDYIFFGNFKWVYSCSSCDLLDVNDPIFTWYKKILKLTKL